MIDINNWKDFKMSDVFEISAGIYHYSSEYEEGDTPYISASETNNGIKERIDLKPDFKGNCVVTGKVGCRAFYQFEDFCATSDVNIIRCKNNEMNENIGLFVASIINFSENYKWSYGRQCRIGDTKNIIIKLPATKDGEPDWNYMDEFIENIENLERESYGSLKDSLETKGEPVQINTEDWSEYRLGDLFNVVYGINLELQDLTENNDGYNFVSRTESNNGVSAKVEKSYGTPNPGKTISVAGGGSVLSTFYQEEPYYSGRDLFYLESKEDISRYAKLFVCTIIKANKYKYNYGRQANRTMSDIVLALPSKKDGNPDWVFMENYIKSLPYGDRV